MLLRRRVFVSGRNKTIVDLAQYKDLRNRSALGRTFRPLTTNVPQRATSSFTKLLFSSHQQDTRPIVPNHSLQLPTNTAQDPTHTIVSLNNETIALPNVYLRDSCQCHKCIDPSTSQKTFNTGDIDPSVRPAALRVINNSLELIWKEQGVADLGSGSNHRSVFPASFLASYVSRPAATQTRMNDHRAIAWDKQIITTQLPDIEVDYSSYMSSPATVHKVVTALMQYGLAFINKCPSGPSTDAEAAVSHITTRIGPLKNTFYGSTWDVKSKQDAKNVAYTSVNLDLHMDLLYYESPPGLQFLHCLENRVEGGGSIFVDAMAVAERMRVKDPQMFEVLCTHPVDFHYDNDGVHYHQTRRTIELHPGTGAITYINYSPPFQGTQTPQGFAAYHCAIARFAELLRGEEVRYETVLKEGQCVVFNNRRVLHARRSFGPGKRWLKGSYADIDALWSKYRTGTRELKAAA